MPSRFEPCGLSQLIALRYGAVPLVRETGGLQDTVQPYNKYTDEGTGFSFANYNAHEMLFTLERAIKNFMDRKLWSRLMVRGMQADFGWDHSAQRYLALYHTIVGCPPENDAGKCEPPAAAAEPGTRPAKKGGKKSSAV